MSVELPAIEFCRVAGAGFWDCGWKSEIVGETRPYKSRI